MQLIPSTRLNQSQSWLSNTILGMYLAFSLLCIAWPMVSDARSPTHADEELNALGNVKHYYDAIYNHLLEASDQNPEIDLLAVLQELDRIKHQIDRKHRIKILEKGIKAAKKVGSKKHLSMYTKERDYLLKLQERDRNKYKKVIIDALGLSEEVDPDQERAKLIAILDEEWDAMLEEEDRKRNEEIFKEISKKLKNDRLKAKKDVASWIEESDKNRIEELGRELFDDGIFGSEVEEDEKHCPQCRSAAKDLDDAINVIKKLDHLSDVEIRRRNELRKGASKEQIHEDEEIETLLEKWLNKYKNRAKTLRDKLLDCEIKACPAKTSLDSLDFSEAPSTEHDGSRDTQVRDILMGSIHQMSPVPTGASYGYDAQPIHGYPKEALNNVKRMGEKLSAMTTQPLNIDEGPSFYIPSTPPIQVAVTAPSVSSAAAQRKTSSTSSSKTAPKISVGPREEPVRKAKQSKKKSKKAMPREIDPAKNQTFRVNTGNTVILKNGIALGLPNATRTASRAKLE